MILVERYHVLVEIWRWLISASVDEVLSIPPVDNVDDLPPETAQGARFLIGFAMNAACTSPRRRITSSGLALRANGRRFYGWTEAFRARVAAQVPLIRHWRVIEGDYSLAPDVTATWFVDPPYILRGGGYIHGPTGLDYAALGRWCRSRRGQMIVCESEGADWLPFRKLGAIKAGPRSAQASAEVIWP